MKSISPIRRWDVDDTGYSVLIMCTYGTVSRPVLEVFDGGSPANVAQLDFGSLTLRADLLEFFHILDPSRKDVKPPVIVIKISSSLD